MGCSLTIGKRQLGATGLQISVLGFGGGGYWGMRAFSESAALSLVDLAVDHGINYFDTGPNYSYGHAEQRLGKALQGRSNIFVGTKCGTHLRKGRHVKDYSAGALSQSLDNSLTNLKRDYVDVLQLHDVPDPLTEDTLEFLFRAKKSGKARLLGASCSPPEAARANENGLLDVVMVVYNVLCHRLTHEFISK